MRRGSGGGAGGLPVGLLSLILSRFGIGGVLIALLAFGAFQYFSAQVADDRPGAADPAATAAADDERVQFASFVLDDIQRTWARKLPGYQKAKLIIFQHATATGCGYGDRATGPFYCPRDGNVYLDLDFFRTLEVKLGAGGDFGQAYVIAHEIGHHVQTQIGTAGKGGTARPGAGGQSVKLELQADCFAGVWAHGTQQRNLLETGDLDEALNAAASIGDDRLQRMGQGTVQPESWTHGSSAQRVEWFRRGLTSGDPAQCDTFQITAR